MTQTRSTASLYALAVAGAAGFIIYGSLAPFDFRNRMWSEAVDAFLWSMQHRVWPASRSDWIANVMLGVPLGFSLLGLARTERSGFFGTLCAAILLWPFCILLALGVEFVQVFIPERTSSGSDVLAQGLGAAVGMIGWMETGPRLTRMLQTWQTSRDTNNLTTRLFVCYLFILALLQFLPLDLTLSPGRIARKLYHDVYFVPFGEFEGLTGEQGWRQIQNWLGLAFTFAPLGILGTHILRLRKTGYQQFWSIIALWAVVPLLFESGQIFVQSRLPTTAGYLIAAFGTSIGGVLVLLQESISRRIAIGLGFSLWILGMIVMMWASFDFQTGISYSDDTLIPIGEIRYSDPIILFCQWATRMIAYSLLGCMVTMSGGSQGSYRLMGCIVGLIFGTVFELGQMFLPLRTPGATDLLLAATGTVIGAVITGRLQSDRQEYAA